MEVDQPDLCQQLGICSGWGLPFCVAGMTRSQSVLKGSKDVVLFILPGTFYLPLTLMVMSLLASSGIKGNYRGSVYLWCGIQGILLWIRLKRFLKSISNVMIRCFCKRPNSQVVK